MYELFESNEQDESLLLLEDNMSKTEAMKALEECNMPICQIEKFDVPESLKSEEKEVKKKGLWEYIRFMGIYGRHTLIATKNYGEIITYYNAQPSRSLVNIDEVRESFMNAVYGVLSDDPTNDRANDIINAFDSLPTIKYN